MTSSCLRKIAATTLLLSCAFLSINCSRKDSTASLEPTPVLSGQPNTTYPMPPWKADAIGANMGWTLPGAKHSTIQDFQGRVLVLDFYATWCAPCRNSIPQLKEIQSRFGPQGLQVIGLNVGGADDRVKVGEFASELKIQYPLAFPDKSLSDIVLSDNDSIPQTLVFDRQGQLVKRFIGFDESTGLQLEQAVRSALSNVSR